MYSQIIITNLIFIFYSSILLSLQIIMTDKDKAKLVSTEKRKADQETEPTKDLKKVSVNI